MRGFFIPLVVWLGSSILIASAISCLFPVAIGYKILIGAFLTACIAGIQKEVWDHLNEKRRILQHQTEMLKVVEEQKMRMMSAAAEAELKMQAEEIEAKLKIAEEASNPSVLCPYCQQKRDFTYIRVPYNFDEKQNVFECPRCKQDFGVSIQVLTYQVEKTIDMGGGN